MIEQVLGGKNLVVTKRDSRADPLEPALNDLFSVRTDIRREL